MPPIYHFSKLNAKLLALKTPEKFISFFQKVIHKIIQARIAQLVAYWLDTGEVPGSNPGKGENFSVKISNWIDRI